MDVPKDDVNSQFTFTYDDIKGTVHVVDKLTGAEAAATTELSSMTIGTT